MFASAGKLLGIACIVSLCAGCANDPLWKMMRGRPMLSPTVKSSEAADDPNSDGANRPAAPAADNAGAGNISGAAARIARSGGPAADPKALTAMLAELNRAGALDEVAEQRLIEDLQKTDPALWPQLIEVFRASLAYRQRYNQAPSELPYEAQDMVAAHRRQDAPVRRAAPARVEAPATLTAEQRQAQPLQPADPVAGPVQLVSAQLPLGQAPAEQPPSGSAAPPPAAAAGSSPVAAAPAGPALVQTAAAVAPPAQAEPQRLDWRGHLQAAIAGLEQETAEPPATTAAIGRHAQLRLLYLVDGRRDSALKSIAGIPPTQQDFWSKELFGLATYLDTERHPDETRRAAAACVPLREAEARLGELSTLSVRNLAFCTEVSSYGVYKRFDKPEFQAGQEVLLYAEVENFKSLPTDKGFHTALKSSYQILDNHGARVDQKDFEITSEHCQNARRDYFTRYFVWMPKRIYGGTYTLQLTIEDTLSQKIGQSSIEFTISEKDQP